MESTGKKGRVQLSEETAALLRQADKGHWIAQREDTVSSHRYFLEAFIV